MISGGDGLRLGAESTLTCSMSGVYPAELLTLDWLRGDAVLQSVQGVSGSGWVQSEYRFVPVKQDFGAKVSCRATLDLQDLPAEDRTRQTSVLLNLLCECVCPAGPLDQNQRWERSHPVWDQNVNSGVSCPPSRSSLVLFVYVDLIVRCHFSWWG